MDLDRCPKCGAEWQGGEICRSCRFVPVGAGLEAQPKKKKRKAKRYVEPGSTGPFLTYALLGLIGFGMYRIQPWKDDWEFVRALAGQGRRHSLVGDWEVTKSLSVKQSPAPVSAGTHVKFNKTGKVKMSLVKGAAKSAAEGEYSVTGQQVAMKEIHTTQTNAGAMPNELSMKLAWTGPDSMVAATDSAAIYMRREKQGNPLARFMQMGIKPGSAEVPGQMRGVISTMQSNVDKESGD